jgi:radical SAM superfamily enzyme YgiQ (UPF0313 family)
MNEGVDAETLLRMIRDLKNAGLCSAIKLIPGFPGETEDEFFSTLEACQALKLQGEFFPFYFLENSPLYRNPERFGVVLEERKDFDLATHVPFAASGLDGISLIQRAAVHFPDIYLPPIRSPATPSTSTFDPMLAV